MTATTYVLEWRDCYSSRKRVERFDRWSDADAYYTDHREYFKELTGYGRLEYVRLVRREGPFWRRRRIVLRSWVRDEVPRA